ncbi:MAG: OsmC family protein [Bacillota bacterium]
MATESVKVSSTLQEDFTAEATTDKHQITADKSKKMGGQDLGMSPAEIILAGLATCAVMTTKTFAKQRQVELNNLQVEAIGKIDLQGFKGDPEVVPGFQSVEFNLYLDSDAPTDKIDELVNLVQDRCPMADTLARSIEVTSYYEVNKG